MSDEENPKEEKKDKRVITQSRKDFSDLLIRRRKDRAFKTAYAFYHQTGGEDKYHISYTHYLRIEAGERLPSPETLAEIMKILTPFKTERIGLIRAFLKAHVGDHPIFNEAFEPIPGAPTPQAETSSASAATSYESALLNHAGKEVVSKVPRMNAAQFEAIQAHPPALWVSTFLNESGLKLGPTQIAAVMKMTQHETNKALEILLEQQLVQKVAGKYSSLYTDSGMFVPVSPTQELGYWAVNQIEKRIDITPEGRKFWGYFYFAASDNDPRLAILVDLMRDAQRKGFLIRDRKQVPKGKIWICMTRIHSLIDYDSGQSSE